MVKKLRKYLLPLMLVTTIEILIALNEFAPDLYEIAPDLLSFPIFIVVVLIVGNSFAYCSVGWISVRGESGRLWSGAVAGMILLIYEAAIRATWFGFAPHSGTDDQLKEIFQLFFKLPSSFTETQINVLLVVLQYVLFSPFYIALSLLGGAVAKWRSGSRKV